VKLNLRTLGLSAIAAAVLVAAAVVVVSQQPGPPPPDGPRGQGPMGPGPMGPGFRGGPQGPGGPGRHEFGPFGPFGRELNLTDDQKAQIQKIQESFRESDKALFDQMRALHDKQGDFAPGPFDEAAFRSAAEARAKIQIELEVSHAKMMSQIFNVLTAEQKAQLQAHHDQMKRMGPPPPPPQPGEQPF
jgi:Spy/CpxP family protein refolding chaperone